MTSGGAKLERWLARQQSKQEVVPASAVGVEVAATSVPGVNASGSGISAHREEGKPPLGVGHVPSTSPRSPPARGGAGGVGACCNLIRLLDAEELTRVHEVLLEAMVEKGVRPPGGRGKANALASPELHGDFQRTPMVLTVTAGDSIKMLTEVLEEVRKLGSEAAQRSQTHRTSSSSAAAKSTDTAAVADSGGTSGDGGEQPPMSAKMSRWLKKVAKNSDAPPADTPPRVDGAEATVEDGASSSGKMSRWINRLNKNKDAVTAGGDTAGVAESGRGAGGPEPEEPLKFVQRACGAVRESWKVGPGNMSLAEEREKLRREREGMEALMAMVYAVKETPEKINPDSPSAGGVAGVVPEAVGKSPAAAPMGGVAVGAGVAGGSKATKPDPDALLAEFLAARKDERKKETAQMIEDKKKPKKVEGSGWRAGSPMASAAQPTVPVRISLSRPPPPPPAPIMLGPPPENLDPEGGSREDVMNKEGGGFFFYPPGHPNYVPGGPGSANIQLEGQLRSSVHPQERIAPHWSRAKFKAHGMPEVTCEARHATFGPLKEISGRLVRCNPPLANKEISNVEQVRGNVVYVKRGGCSFTKKARVAQKAGAVGMVVANSDRETFGMSYTDDGEPFDAIQIPCVMISSDICTKLESCKQVRLKSPSLHAGLCLSVLLPCPQVDELFHGCL